MQIVSRRLKSGLSPDPKAPAIVVGNITTAKMGNAKNLFVTILSILSDVTPEKFALLVASEDSKTLTRTKGIGAKTAQRIVLELKDKIVKENINIADAQGNIGAFVSEAFSALLVLGYTQSEIAPVMAKLDSSLPSAELIKLALKAMAQKMNK